ncbi:MAG: glucose-1-phosphate thymidylyltransferase [Chloroflexota bacterium]
MMLGPGDFFDLDDGLTARLFDDCEYVWQALWGLKERLDQLLDGERRILGNVMPGAYLGDNPIYVAKGAVVEPGAYILGPAYIGEGAVVRHGALVRNDVILLPGSILGHACETKHSIFLPTAVAPHFNYVGDSILGRRVNLGAGTKLSNLTLVSEKDPQTKKRPTIKLEVDGVELDTNLAKLGAILGDDVQTGCNAVLNPGCLIGKNSLVYANLSLRKGYYPPNSIFKLRQTIESVQRR